MAGRIRRGDIRWYRFPPPDKQRPVLVLTRQSSIGYLAHATVAEITRSIRGVPSEVPLGTDDGMREPCAINLHHVNTIPRRRIGSLLARLPEHRWPKVQTALLFALGF